MEDEDLKLATKESQLQLLGQVLATSEADADEEDIKVSINRKKRFEYTLKKYF